jgi:F0F1-type ATP synthase membrane subunit b/b'
LTSTQESLWWVTLGLALIVLLAVAAFLTVLVMLVNTIETRVNVIRETLDQAASNTADTALIAETADRVDAVLSEGLKHHLFLGRVLDKVRS